MVRDLIIGCKTCDQVLQILYHGSVGAPAALFLMARKKRGKSFVVGKDDTIACVE